MRPHDPFSMLYLYDLPLSFAADTVLLPATLIQQLVGRVAAPLSPTDIDPGQIGESPTVEAEQDQPYPFSSVDGEDAAPRWKIMMSWFGDCPYPLYECDQMIGAVTSIFRAAARYREANGHWPDEISEVSQHLYAGIEDDDIAWQVPKDPWANEFVLVDPLAGHDGIHILCLGEDGAEGGEGVEADYLFPRRDHVFPEKEEASADGE